MAMHAILRLALPFVATAALYVLLQILELVYRDLSSSIRNIVGPKSSSWLYGSVKQLEDNPSISSTWRDTYGPTYQFRTVLNTRELYTADVAAIEHIVKNNLIYQKRVVATGANDRLVGEGLLGVEGDAHRRQNPAFGSTQIRSLMSVFLEKSVERVSNMIDGDSEAATRIDVLDWLTKVTLDIIGEAGFDIHFNSVNPDNKPNDVLETFNNFFHAPNTAGLHALRTTPGLTLLKYLPLPGRKAFDATRLQLARLGNQLLREGKAAINAAGGPKAFSLILRANMSTDIPDNHRMTDNEVIGQIPTFFVAGHATTSSAIAWALHELSAHPDIQDKLRAELLSVPDETPTLEELNALPYLDSFIRETLRLHAPVAHVARMAVADDVLPLARRRMIVLGVSITLYSAIKKGQNVRIAIADVNTDVAVWGPDAHEFKPERWTNPLPTAVETVPSVWGNLLTFFAGPHNCIGFPLLFVLVRTLEFKPVFKATEIGRSGSALQRPCVVSEGKRGQMPLFVKLYQG
ncbi:cytochrome P450 [Favolaschia claudopus]|uniref:Cytochrome P450 n=1 Tax=Favolaschia claudopus TaxID=2862362 RepID=A0AAV9ZIW1_9AGAR